MKKIVLSEVIFRTATLILLVLVSLGCARIGSQNTNLVPTSAYLPLPNTVGASGTVRSNQSALLTWKTSGTVDATEVVSGDLVQQGQELASLKRDSLPRQVILAQADLVSAKNALDDLLNSRLQQAQALQAVEAAQRALEDLNNPELAQARAGQVVANAQKALDTAEQDLLYLTTPPSQQTLDQAQASMLLAEKKVQDTQAQIDQIKIQMQKVPPAFRTRFQKALDGLQLQLAYDQSAYEQKIARYDELLAPPDPVDVAQAKAQVSAAQAQLAQAQKDLDRINSGPTPAQLALAQANLEDAQRTWESLKDGPTQEDLTVAQARVAAAEALLSQMNIVAPFAGTITQVFSQPGDQVSLGSPAFRLDDLTNLYLDVQVSEVDINQVKPGQEVLLNFDAVPDKEYTGVVDKVSQVGEQALGIVNYLVTVKLTGADALIRPGMTAAVEILMD